MHDFTAGERRYADAEAGVECTDDEGRATLAEVAPKAGQTFTYLYDFGDGWEHNIKVEEITAPKEGARYPVCVAGKRAAPPEDCGGIWGYADFLEAIANPEHAQHDEMLEWVGGEFDPEWFDVDEVNVCLRSVR
jgi:hypothetical protein